MWVAEQNILSALLGALGFWLIFAVGYPFLFGRKFKNLDSSMKIAQTERASRALSFERELKRLTIYISGQPKSDVTKGIEYPSQSP
jgi:hypothetical protein